MHTAMDIDALTESLQEFERKEKKETNPLLDQFLCHVGKTGQALIPWSQFKKYFVFKLETVMDDFHESAPEQRVLHNPNVEYIPFDEMKKRILKIVDGYNGIPFTIQRLCELLTEPKRNYTGTDKFLRGLEKNVMVVSCVYPTSEKNGAAGLNRMNGVMFPGNTYSDSRDMNGPGSPKSLNRPKLSSSFSTNGLPDCVVSKEATIQEEERHQISSDSSSPERESLLCSGIKNKHLEEDELVVDEHEVKRAKFGEQVEKDDGEIIDKEASCGCTESLSDAQRSPEGTCEQQFKRSSSPNTPVTLEDLEPSSTQTEVSANEDQAAEMRPSCSLEPDCMEQSEDASDRSASFEEDSGESSCSSSSSSSSSGSSSIGSSDEKGLPADVPVLSPCNTCDSPTEGGAHSSNRTDSAAEPKSLD